jgi:hypothetical protein
MRRRSSLERVRVGCAARQMVPDLCCIRCRTYPYRAGREAQGGAVGQGEPSGRLARGTMPVFALRPCGDDPEMGVRIGASLVRSPVQRCGRKLVPGMCAGASARAGQSGNACHAGTVAKPLSVARRECGRHGLLDRASPEPKCGRFRRGWLIPARRARRNDAKRGGAPEPVLLAGSSACQCETAPDSQLVISKFTDRSTMGNGGLQIVVACKGGGGDC